MLKCLDFGMLWVGDLASGRSVDGSGDVSSLEQTIHMALVLFPTSLALMVLVP